MNKELEAFDAFWRTYPRKVAKGEARKKFAKALKVASLEEIMEGLSRQLPYFASRENEFIPHPSTWLNQERWADEVQPIRVPQQRRTLADAAAEFRSTLGHLNAPAWISDQSKH
jgi:hypothetical protein